MHRRLAVIIATLSLSACAAPIVIGQERQAEPVRSAAFGPYPEIDRKRCEALTQDQADKLYRNILATGRCNPNNHHPHDTGNSAGNNTGHSDSHNHDHI